MSNFIIDPIDNKQLSLFSYEGKHLLKSYITYYNKVIQSGGAGGGGCKCGDSGCSDCTNQRRAEDSAEGGGGGGSGRATPNSRSAAATTGSAARSNDGGGGRAADARAAQRAAAERHKNSIKVMSRTMDFHAPRAKRMLANVLGLKTRVPPTDLNPDEIQIKLEVAGSGVELGKPKVNKNDKVYDIILKARREARGDILKLVYYKKIMNEEGQETGRFSLQEMDNNKSIHEYIDDNPDMIFAAVLNPKLPETLAAVREAPWALGHASPELRGDKEVVLAALQSDRGQFMVFRHASEALRGDREVVLTAVQNNGYDFRHASKELKRDRNFVLEAVQHKGTALLHASPDLKNDIGVVLAAVQQTGFALHHASTELKGNRKVVLAAVQQNGNALGYASEALKDNKEVVLAAVQQNGNALQYASEALRGDSGVVLAAERDLKRRALQ